MSHTGSSKILAIWLLTCLPIGAALAVDAPMPFKSDKLHLGVGTCASSTCHGSAVGLEDSPVLQNEYYLWAREDAHSNAYKLLFTPEGKRIAKNLGVKAAHEERACLICHTDYAEPAQRGRKYGFSDGVGCEACHGPAQNYLGTHVSGANSHQDNLADGLFPLEDPAARAELCLNCHLGSDDVPIDHDIMGAGHPPLVFELDTFTAIQPAHFRVDADYVKRKSPPPNVNTWASGQIMAARFQLDGLLGRRFSRDGVFPELVFYDCNACHHPMKPPRWNPGIAGQLGPGRVRLHDAHLTMTGLALAAFAPDRQARWDSALIQLHAASSESLEKLRGVASDMRSQLAGMPEMAARQKLDKKTLLDLMGAIAASSSGSDLGDFTAAQQTQMAMDAITATLEAEFSTRPAGLKAALDALFESVDTRVKYQPDKFRAALASLRKAIGR